MHEHELFETSDLALVAALCSLGYPIYSVDKSQERAKFFIKRDNYLEEHIKTFWTHLMRVDPLSYFAALKEAKSRIYSN